MGKAPNWTIRTLFVVIASSLIGFWLFDGVAWAASLVGAGFKVEVTARIAGAVVCVSFALVVEQAIMIKESLDSHQRGLSAALEHNMREQLTTGMRDLLVNADILTLARDLQNQQVRSVVTDIGALLQPIATLGEPLRSGVIAWMRGDPLELYRKSASDLTSSGVSASLSQHVAVTRAIFNSTAQEYIQINHSAYDPATQWSREWIDFLSTTRAGTRSMKYIVIGTRDYLAEARPKLHEMQTYLRRCSAELLVCDRGLVTDSLGPFEWDFNMEMFDNAVIKTQSLSPEGYRGGIRLTMSLTAADDRPELQKIIRAVRESATPFKIKERRT